MISREILQRVPAQGFRSVKTESVAFALSSSGSQQWQRMFVGSSDGALALYECTPEQPRSGNPYNFELAQITREAARDKKSPAFNIRVAEVCHIPLNYFHFASLYLSPLPFPALHFISFHFISLNSLGELCYASWMAL